MQPRLQDCINSYPIPIRKAVLAYYLTADLIHEAWQLAIGTPSIRVLYDSLDHSLIFTSKRDDDLEMFNLLTTEHPAGKESELVTLTGDTIFTLTLPVEPSNDYPTETVYANYTLRRKGEDPNINVKGSTQTKHTVLEQYHRTQMIWYAFQALTIDQLVISHVDDRGVHFSTSAIYFNKPGDT